MIVNIQDDILKLRRMDLLDRLLADKTAKRNIMWATEEYAPFGEGYEQNGVITPELITGGHSDVIKTRARKEMERQSERTRQRGEVFTPLWICRKMNDHADEAWFGHADVFFQGETPTPRVVFPKRKSWKRYVNSRRLELACGEGPYLVSRYDVETGEAIPIPDRVGLLDRKLRVVGENAQDEAEWLEWTYRAYWSSYGFDFQGDNVLIARVNLMMTFEEYMEAQWGRRPAPEEYQKLAHIIAWNIWQMDGLTGRVPYWAEEGLPPVDWFGMLGECGEREKKPEDKQPRCRIFNWLGERSEEFLALPIGGNHGMKFDVVIGNPPYQEENANNGRKPPIYHLFMSSAYQVGAVVELITPARFLFNAGQTPKQWNRKMLEDKHLKVLYYEPDGAKVFPNTDIKGGVAITYRDEGADFGGIGVFTAQEELSSVIDKVSGDKKHDMFDSIISPRGLYRFTEGFFKDYPDAPQKIGAGTGNMIASNGFERLPEAFLSEAPRHAAKYVKLYGRLENARVTRYIKRSYLIPNPYLDTYNVLVPKANGTGVFGEALSTPFIAGPGEGTVDTFICLGMFSAQDEAQAALKYVKTKFLRALLGVKKVTQDNPKSVWNMIPLQDFTSASDIDWSQSIQEIDRQLYAKYGLDGDEIDFIETHVKEMS